VAVTAITFLTTGEKPKKQAQQGDKTEVGIKSVDVSYLSTILYLGPMFGF